MDEVPPPQEPQPVAQAPVAHPHLVWWSLCILAVALVSGGLVYAYWQVSAPAPIEEEVEHLVDIDGRTSPYLKDRTYVYYRSYYREIGDEELKYEDEIISGADPGTFTVLTCGVGAGVGGDGCEVYYAKDKNRAYIENSVWEGVDLNTLVYVGGNVMKDSQQVYYANNFDNPLCVACREADSETFEWLGAGHYAGYFKDKQRVYSWMSPVEGADVESFKVVTDNPAYDSQDKNHKYLYGDIITTTSQDSELITLLDQRGNPRFYKNATSVWVLGEMPPDPALIPGADPKTFTPLIYPYSKDATSAFCFDREVLSTDVESFEVIEREGSIDNLYARDKNRIYRCTNVVVGADLATFKAVNNPNVGYDAEDKNHTYHWGKIWGEIAE